MFGAGWAAAPEPVGQGKRGRKARDVDAIPGRGSSQREEVDEG